MEANDIKIAKALKRGVEMDRPWQRLEACEQESGGAKTYHQKSMNGSTRF